MNQDLNQMTNAELKRYISEHRNDDQAFRAGLQVLMNHRDPNAVRYPYPFDMVDPVGEVEAILKERLGQTE